MAIRVLVVVLGVALLASPLGHASRPFASSDSGSSIGQVISEFFAAVSKGFQTPGGWSTQNQEDNVAAIALAADATQQPDADNRATAVSLSGEDNDVITTTLPDSDNSISLPAQPEEADNAVVSIPNIQATQSAADDNVAAAAGFASSSTEEDDAAVVAGTLRLPQAAIDELAAAMVTAGSKPDEPADDNTAAAEADLEVSSAEDNTATAAGSAGPKVSSGDAKDNSADAVPTGLSFDEDDDNVAVSVGANVGRSNAVLLESALRDAIAASEEDNTAAIGSGAAVKDGKIVSAFVKVTAEDAADNSAVVAPLDNEASGSSNTGIEQIVVDELAAVLGSRSSFDQPQNPDNGVVVRSQEVGEDNVAAATYIETAQAEMRDSVPVLEFLGATSGGNSAVAGAAVNMGNYDNAGVSAAGANIDGPSLLREALKAALAASEEDNSAVISVDDNSGIAGNVQPAELGAAVDRTSEPVKGLADDLASFMKLPFSLPSILTQNEAETDASLSAAIF